MRFRHALAITVLLLSLPVGLLAATHMILPDGTGDFPTIAAGISNSAAGDTVLLADGTFRGSGNRDISFTGRPLAVISATNDPETCIIDCGGIPGDYHRAFVIAPTDVDILISGIQIRNGYSSEVGGAIRISGSNPRITNCRFVNNSAAQYGGAIASESNSTAVIERCVFDGNRTWSTGAGITFYNAASGTVRNCTFFGGTAHSGSALAFYNTGTYEISNVLMAFNTITNGPHSAVYVSAPMPVLSCCDIYGNTGGDWVGPIAAQLGQRGNFSADPLFCTPQEHLLGLMADSPCGPDNNPDCGLVGALGVMCPASSVPDDSIWASSNGLQAVPNPSVDGVRVTWASDRESFAMPVHLTLWDVTGRLVRAIDVDQTGAGGTGVLVKYLDASGRELPSGTYFMRVTRGSSAATLRVVKMPR